ncbi:hypothetical protein Bca52824_070597 [Brassica carinata]|uniref:Uncharacterized protein n=1 Tax=Brassica carinata TaxID=52824 RepID=A0A8X7Q5U2_BRACI|nr:hypothetical protein Bca52824_070597 [Brassica carinata]
MQFAASNLTSSDRFPISGGRPPSKALKLLLYKSRTRRFASPAESSSGYEPLKTLLERFRRRRSERLAISGGMRPEIWLAARERFCRRGKRDTSGERVPERLRPDRSREVT